MERLHSKEIIKWLDKIIESKYMLGIIFLGTTVVYGILCFGPNIWLDEAITGSWLRMNSHDIIQAAASDVHPPLYYLIVRMAVLVFGDYIYVAKWASFASLMLLLLVVMTKVRKLFGARTAFLMSALLCVTPCIIQKAMEIRMYQWAMFFVTSFAVFLYSAVQGCEGESKKHKCLDWLAAWLFGLAAAYTHYYALIAVAIFYIAVLGCWFRDKKIRNRIILLISGSCVSYLPWMMVMLGQLTNEVDWWNEVSITISYVLSYIFYPFEEKTGMEKYVFAVLIVVCLICNWFTKEANHKKMAYCCIGTYLGLILVGMLIVAFYRPIFVTRYMYPLVGLLLLGMCIVLSRMHTVFIYALCLFVLLLGAKTYNSQLHYQYDPESTPKLASFLEEHQGEDAIYIYDNAAIDCFLDYYVPEIRSISGEAVLQREVEAESVYYCIADSDKPEQVIMNELGLTDYEKLEHINLLYHSFDIYELK